jgi:glycosyltransferase involved in cell wall biosynthesis
MLISIITVVKNNLPGLQRTMQSIIGQTYEDWECIIIDAGLSQSVLEYVNSINDRRVKLIQELDSGIYDGMNKGLANATGEIINFLNTDDTYASKAVLELIAMLARFIRNEKNFVIKGMADSSDIHEPERLTRTTLLRRCPNHQTVFYGKNTIAKGYENRLRLAGDWAHFFENISDLRVVYVDVILIHYKRGGLADNIDAHLLAWKERFLFTTSLSKKSLVIKLPYILISILGIIYSHWKIMRNRICVYVKKKLNYRDA